MAYVLECVPLEWVMRRGGGVEAEAGYELLCSP